MIGTARERGGQMPLIGFRFVDMGVTPVDTSFAITAYDMNVFGNYDLAWKLAVTIGLAAGLFQMTMNIQPSERIRLQSA
jgi:hypothetical protein